MALSEKNQDKLVNIGLYTAGGIIIYFVLKKGIQAANKNNTEASLMDNASAQQAQKLRAAFNPSGSSWLISTDGTKNDVVFKVAKEITDFPAVAKAYQAFYNSSLSDDLTAELTGDELERFYKLAQGAKTSAKLATQFKLQIGDDVVTSVRPGFKYVSYYLGPIGQGVLKVAANHTKPGAFAGTVAQRIIGPVKVNGKVVRREMYGLKRIPMKGLDSKKIYWVWGDDLKKMR